MIKKFTTLVCMAAVVALTLMNGCAGKDGVAGVAGKDGLDNTANIKCTQCHANSQLIVAKEREWSQSKHAATETGNSFDYAGQRTTCQPCHNGAVFPLWVAGNKDTTSFKNLGILNNNTSTNCRTCHNIHTAYDTTDWGLTTTSAVNLLMDPTVAYSSGKGNLCSNCHQARTNEAAIIAALAATDSFKVSSIHWGPHHGPQANMNLGMGGYEDASTGLAVKRSEHKLVITNGCVQCHVSDAASQNHTFIPVVAACNAGSCHGANPVVLKSIVVKDSTNIGVYYDTLNYQVDSVQVYVNRLSHELRDSLVAKGAATNDIASGFRVYPKAVKMPKAVAGCLYNLVYVLEDRSTGIHNGKYELYLLVNSLKVLGVSRDLTKYYN